MNIPINRTVALATPLVFAPLAGAVTALAARYAPGVEIDEGQLQAIFIAGATIALAKASLWLKGWQDYEKGQELPADALDAANDMPHLAALAEPDLEPGMPTESEFATVIEDESEDHALDVHEDDAEEGDDLDPAEDDDLALVDAVALEADAAADDDERG